MLFSRSLLDIWEWKPNIGLVDVSWPQGCCREYRTTDHKHGEFRHDRTQVGWLDSVWSRRDVYVSPRGDVDVCGAIALMYGVPEDSDIVRAPYLCTIPQTMLVFPEVTGSIAGGWLRAYA